MNNVIKFGDWFTWESHDDYVDEAMDDSADIAAVVNAILSDEAKMKEHNFKDHGDVNGIHIYTFTTDEYIFICHYIYADEHQAYLVRHQNMSALTEYTVGETFGVTEEAIYYDENGM